MLKLVPDWPKAVGFPASHLHGSTLSPAHVTQLLPRPYGRVQTPYRGYSVTPLCFSHYVEIEVDRARHRQRTHHCQRCSSVSFPCWRLRLYKNVRIILMMFLDYPWLLTEHVFFICMCLSERCIHSMQSSGCFSSLLAALGKRKISVMCSFGGDLFILYFKDTELDCQC